MQTSKLKIQYFKIFFYFRSDVMQTIELTQGSNSLYFNFCEKEVTWETCVGTDDTYAYIQTASGCEAIKPSDDDADTVATQMTD